MNIYLKIKYISNHILCISKREKEKIEKIKNQKVAEAEI